MRLPRSMAACALACTIVAAPAAASDDGWDAASDIGRGVLVAASLGVPAIEGDWAGEVQAAGSLLLASGTTYGLKRIFPQDRPDGSGRHSFPSGHASVSFAAAATLDNRYGWKAGVPAFIVATFVSFARVEARKHQWHDVAAGAALGTGIGLLLTSKRTAGVRLLPFGDSKGGGLSLAMRF